MRILLFWVIMCCVVARNYHYSPHNNPEEQVSYACWLLFLTKLPTEKTAWDVETLKAQLRKQEIKYPIITEQSRSCQISRLCRLSSLTVSESSKGICSSRPNCASALTHRVPQAFERGRQEKMFIHLESVSRHTALSGQPLLNENKMAVFPHLTYTP